MKKKKLKPVVYTTSYYQKGAPDKIKQNLLLQAMKVTSDPKKLKEMIGVRTVAEVYRTLDKLSIRKEFHEALARNGVSLDYIVKGIKGVADTAEKDGDKIKAFNALLKSIGMDKYEAVDDSGGGTWEDALLKAIESEKKEKDDLVRKGLLQSGEDDGDEYGVVKPEVPERIKTMQEEEEELTSNIYD
jgi:hypothetical protein